MKSYLLIPLFFLGTLSFSISIFGQENRINQQLEHIENPIEHSSMEYQLDYADHNTDTSPMHSDIDHRDSTGIWSERNPHEAETFQTKFFNMLFILGLLIGFMILASWALKRMMKSKMTHLNTASSIKVLETRYLSPRATLYLVEVQDKSFLIAESPTHVTHITTFPIEEEESAAQGPPSFPSS